MTGYCALCGSVRNCNTECGGGGWADSCERPDGSMDTELRELLSSREWRVEAYKRGQAIASEKKSDRKG